MLKFARWVEPKMRVHLYQALEVYNSNAMLMLPMAKHTKFLLGQIYDTTY